MSTTPDHVPTEVAGLPEAGAPELVELFSFSVMP
jgi:hypothetical protein